MILGPFTKIQYFDSSGPLKSTTILVIPKGEGLNAIADRLSRENIIENKWLFVASAYYFGVNKKLKFGEYQIQKNSSMRKVLDTLLEGRSIFYKITLSLEKYGFLVSYK